MTPFDVFTRAWPLITVLGAGSGRSTSSSLTTLAVFAFLSTLVRAQSLPPSPTTLPTTTQYLTVTDQNSPSYVNFSQDAGAYTLFQRYFSKMHEAQNSLKRL